MITVETTHASLTENFRCEDQSLLSVSGQAGQNKNANDDRSIVQKVNRAIWNEDTLRDKDVQEIEVIVKDGTVYLSGHVIGIKNLQQAEEAAHTITGVRGVINNLVADDQILREVALTLGKIEHTYGVKFFTGARNGVVILNGDVDNSAVSSIAEKSVTQIPGVRGVLNYVRISKADLQTKGENFFQPLIGEVIYFKDGLMGTVIKVVINPDNLRVISMIVHPQTPDLLYGFGSMQASEKTADTLDLVIIPVNLIRYLTKESGFLLIDSTETSRYGIFYPECFQSPPKAWIPPFPYCAENVVFPAEPPHENDPD